MMIADTSLEELSAQELNALGNAYADSGRWAEAQACYQRGLTLRQKAGDLRSEGVVLNSLGALYHRAGLYLGIIGALVLARMAHQVFTRSSDPTAYYGWWTFLVPLMLFASRFFASWWYGRAYLVNRGNAARAGTLAGFIAGLGIFLIRALEPSPGLEDWAIIGPILGVILGAVGGALGWRRPKGAS